MAQGELTQWRERARCNGNDPAITKLFFSEDKENEARAKAICATCDVWRPCLKYAVQNGEKHGVWGGRTPRERSRLSAFKELLASGTVYVERPVVDPQPSFFSFSDAAAAIRFTFAASYVSERPSMLA